MILKPIALAVKHAIIPSAVQSVGAFTASAVGRTAPKNLLSAATLIRGGSSALIDLDRTGLRLESLEEYTVIASLVIGCVMDIYDSCPKEGFKRPIDKVAQFIHGVSTTVSFLSGLFVVLVFSLFLQYAQTALGTSADSVYIQLLQQTGKVRYEGFRAFLICLVSLKIALGANIYLTFKGRSRWVYLGLFALGTAYCLQDWFYIVAMATKYIFS